MSIILDALKKAEKDRSNTDSQNGTPKSGASIVDDDKKTPSKFSVRPQFVAVLLVLSALIFFGIRYAPKMILMVKQWQVSQTTAVVSPTVYKPRIPQTDKPAKVELAQENVADLKLKALSLYEEGQIEKSLEQWKDLSKLAPDDAEVFNNLGVSYKRLNEKKKAAEAYGRALELNSDYPEALNNRGTLLIESLDFNGAKEDFSRAITLNPDYAEPHFHLASLYEKEGNLKEAIKHYEVFLKFDPEIIAELKRKIDLRVDILKIRLDKEGQN